MLAVGALVAESALSGDGASPTSPGVVARATAAAAPAGDATPAPTTATTPRGDTAGAQAAARDYGYPYPQAPDCPEQQPDGHCAPDRWQMVQGQCTSWVAFRLNELRGVAFDADYRGVRWGDAREWLTSANAARLRVDDLPVAGSVAWFGTRIGASRGHVAYVESVRADGSVVISEMNFDSRNGFRLRIITRDAGWPEAFIHFV